MLLPLLLSSSIQDPAQVPQYQSPRPGKGQALPNLPKPHRTVLLLFLILFHNPTTNQLSWKEKKTTIASYTALPQWSPLRPTKNEDKLGMFICQFYFPPICFSPEMERESGTQTILFLQLLQSLSSCPPVVHTMPKPA